MSRHPSEENILRFFEYDHLPEPLKSVAAQCAVLANNMADLINTDPELIVGLRKLLEAKDSFVRATLVMENQRKGLPEGKPL